MILSFSFSARKSVPIYYHKKIITGLMPEKGVWVLFSLLIVAELFFMIFSSSWAETYSGMA